MTYSPAETQEAIASPRVGDRWLGTGKKPTTIEIVAMFRWVAKKRDVITYHLTNLRREPDNLRSEWVDTYADGMQGATLIRRGPAEGGK